MEVAFIISVVLLGGSLLFLVVALLTKPFRMTKARREADAPVSISMQVQGRKVIIPMPSADKLAAWNERKELNENNAASCEAEPGEDEMRVPVSFFAPGCGLAGWSKYDTYWEACNRASWKGYRNIVVKVSDYEEAIAYIEENKRREELLKTTSELNNKGIAYEKAGEIEAAISTYEECIKLRYPATHAYYRLMVLYRKAKDTVNEERVIRVAIEMFPNEEKYKERLTRLLARVAK